MPGGGPVVVKDTQVEEACVVATTSQLCEALDLYQPANQHEVADVRRIRAASSNADIFSRSSLLHATGSALVVHPPSGRVLLRWHPRMQRWMQVGGHFDPAETDPLQVAIREAHEETGLRDLVALPAHDRPLQIVIVPVPEHGDEPAHEHADFRYVFVTNQPDAIQRESSGAILRWTPFATASSEMAEQNLRIFLARAVTMVAFGRDAGDL